MLRSIERGSRIKKLVRLWHEIGWHGHCDWLPLFDEHLRIQGRKTGYEDLPQLQADLDLFLKAYNHDRPHQGRGMKGRTPVAVFLAGIKSQPECESQTNPAT